MVKSFSEMASSSLALSLSPRVQILFAFLSVPLRTPLPPAFTRALSPSPIATLLRRRPSPSVVTPAVARGVRTVDGSRWTGSAGSGSGVSRVTPDDNSYHRGRRSSHHDSFRKSPSLANDSTMTFEEANDSSDAGATGKVHIADRISDGREDEGSDEDDEATVEYLPGIPATFAVMERATVPAGGFAPPRLAAAFEDRDVRRLRLRTEDVTVPAALVLMMPGEFPTLTKARKETRQKKILLYKHTEGDDPLAGEGGAAVFDRERLAVAKVADRVRPGDTLAIQVRMSHNYDVCRDHDDDPPFALPVVYEDDHFAIVDKPEGVVVFSHRGGGFGRHSIKACLPWHVAPPRPGTASVLRRPNPVHRIDRGTSGLLVCAKTRPAMTELARMFKERLVQKTYTAVVNGDMPEPNNSRITPKEARDLGVCIGDGEPGAHESGWHIIDEELEDQSAVTLWRPVCRRPLENARNGTATVVELKPKTGRYHQLRRHMAWVGKCPLLGDKSYDGGGLAKTLRGKGFYLCSNKVVIQHPYYNTPRGRREWDAKKDVILGGETGAASSDDWSVFRISERTDGVVIVYCEINLPVKFKEFLVDPTETRKRKQEMAGVDTLRDE